jgi:AcrR family transcriptional regulator
MVAKGRWASDRSFVDRLIDSGEALYGKHGLDGVSLRQIGSAAGTGNNYAVQFHFGNVKGLIQAILKKRLPVVELKRGQLLAHAKAQQQLNDTRTLMGIMFRPLLEFVDCNGERTHARFVLALLQTAEGVQYSSELFAHTNSIHVMDLLQAANPHIPPSVLGERLRLMAIMILTSVFNRVPPYDQNEFDGALIEDVLDTSTAALSAPVGKSVASILQLSEVMPENSKMSEHAYRNILP